MCHPFLNQIILSDFEKHKYRLVREDNCNQMIAKNRIHLELLLKLLQQLQFQLNHNSHLISQLDSRLEYDLDCADSHAEVY